MRNSKKDRARKIPIAIWEAARAEMKQASEALSHLADIAPEPSPYESPYPDWVKSAFEKLRELSGRPALLAKLMEALYNIETGCPFSEGIEDVDDLLRQLALADKIEDVAALRAIAKGFCRT